MEYAAELSGQLSKHGLELEKLYSALNKKVKAGVNDQKQYHAIFKEMDELEKWFADAQAGKELVVFSSCAASMKCNHKSSPVAFQFSVCPFQRSPQGSADGILKPKKPKSKGKAKAKARNAK